MSGRVVHFEIPADDIERARAFYGEAFGWSITPMPEMNYTVVSTAEADETGVPKERGAINGGMMARQGQITAPVVVIESDDIDAALQAVEKLGGATVEPKMPVGEMGFAAYFSDTEGNVVGLWQNAQR
ncbi:MAG: glyoxalase [Actinobacteria bacterium 13_2_20CM_2_71_6]|nr:MAG: glyoxalase [Actinobacteria bacterium 13_2_20CM_2_71_6]